MASVMTGTTTASIDGGPDCRCDVLIEQNVEFVRSEYAVKPDPEWLHTDGNGHVHAFTKDRELPTLRTEQIPCDGACGDPEHTGTRYRCLICGEVVEPQYVPDHDARNRGFPIYGPKSGEITVYADRPILARTVSVRVRTEDMEAIGVGDVRSTNSDGTTEIALRFIEPRLGA